jgi:energy-coupling factor transport system ATP-binding protein
VNRTAAIRFDNFTFRYRTQAEPSLYGVNLVINSGEKVLIAGPSGSGKSTLIHCMNGLIPHAFSGAIEGSLFIFGEDAAKMDIPAVSKKAGTVLQDTDGQFVALTAAEDIAFAAENDCVPVDEIHRRVDKAAGLVQMEEHLGKAPQDLSGGQKQRISIAGILMENTGILLFDEPLANLDPAAGKEAVELIDDLYRSTEKTVIIVEHRLEDALHRPVDRIIVMDRGRITADMNPSELLASGILRNTGLREPLYISGLRYAGITVRAENNPEDLARLSFDPAPIREWKGLPPGTKEKKPAPPVLEIKNLSFGYGDIAEKPALIDVSFEVRKGECFCIAGKNGAGKSTLAKIICGFVKPSSGAVFYDGKDIAPLSIRERASRIGYVMQNPNQMISFPMIYDEAALSPRMAGLAENEVREKVYGAFSVCGLYPFRNWPVSALSYGQKKRLTIASVLVMNVEVLILDEPTAGQDFRHYSEIMEFLSNLRKQKCLTLILVTHDMHLMLEYSDRTAAFSEGRLIALDSPAAVLTDDRIIEEACLKRTSLYDLAVISGLDDPRLYVERFIAWDRNMRETARAL